MHILIIEPLFLYSLNSLQIVRLKNTTATNMLWADILYVGIGGPLHLFCVGKNQTIDKTKLTSKGLDHS